MELKEQFDQMEKFISENLKEFAFEMVLWDQTSLLKQDGYFSKASAMIPTINSLERNRIIKEIVSFNCVKVVANTKLIKKWEIFVRDSEYDREVVNGKCFGVVEAETKEQAENKGQYLLGNHIVAGCWAVEIKD